TIRMFKDDEKAFFEVKKLIADGTADSKIRYDLGILQPTLTIVKKYDSFADYETHFAGAAAEEEDENEEEPKEERTRTVQSSKPVKEYEKGYFRVSLAKA